MVNTHGMGVAIADRITYPARPYPCQSLVPTKPLTALQKCDLIVYIYLVQPIHYTIDCMLLFLPHPTLKSMHYEITATYDMGKSTVLLSPSASPTLLV